MKFCLNSRHPPDGILAGHSSNKIADLLVNLGAPDTTVSGLPVPIAPEALPVPFDNCLWLNDHEYGAPVPPQL